MTPASLNVFNSWRNLTWHQSWVTLSSTCSFGQQEQRSPTALASVLQAVRALRVRGDSAVRRMKPAVPPSLFRAGESIPESGLYRVLHGGHRGNHEAVLLRGELFPRCQVCAENVHFELLQAAPHLNSNENRKRRLYELPHPERAKSKSA